LDDDQLYRLAQNPVPKEERKATSNVSLEQLSKPVHKVSVRDLSWVIASQACGATTVAATGSLAFPWFDIFLGLDFHMLINNNCAYSVY